MKRTNTILWSIATVVVAAAIAAGPAAATSGYEWLNSTPGSDPAATAQPSATGHSSITAILGSQTVPDEQVSVVEASTGFDWGDAFIGAGVALALVLISGVTYYEVRRHARVTVARA